MDTATEPRKPAEIYDEFFVPALFRKWGPVVAAAADVKDGDRVLDVACGTGALTLAVADKVGSKGSVVGLDPNPEMLEVARRKPARIEWVEAPAESLPFADRSFDAVVSQFGFMFFNDRTRALREMMRVLGPGGKMAVAVCDAVENSPGYAALANLLDRLFGKNVGDAFREPFVLGDPELLLQIFRRADMPETKIERRSGMVRFKSIGSLVSTERACAWTLGGTLDDDQFERLLDESETALRPFVAQDGTIEFDMPVLIATTKSH